MLAGSRRQDAPIAIGLAQVATQSSGHLWRVGTMDGPKKLCWPQLKICFRRLEVQFRRLQRSTIPFLVSRVHGAIFGALAGAF